MDYFAGLDVSVKETSVCIVDDAVCLQHCPHMPLLLLMLEAGICGPRFTISLKRSTLFLQLSTKLVGRLPAIERIERFLRTLPPPPSPHRPDAAAVERGKAVFAANCAECHAPGGARTLSVIPLAEVGTDINRSHMWTELARDTYNNFREGRDWGFESFRKISGYVAEPLPGLWLNGPYLHNGSVPTLRDLLEPPPQRPTAFVRGLDVLDARNGGFLAPACNPRERPPEGFCFDTRLIGNSNEGHLYGTALPASDKGDLLAYLLTL